MIGELPKPTTADFLEMSQRNLTWHELCQARAGASPQSTPEEKRKSTAWWQAEQREVYKVV